MQPDVQPVVQPAASCIRSFGGPGHAVDAVCVSVCLSVLKIIEINDFLSGYLARLFIFILYRSSLRYRM